MNSVIHNITRKFNNGYLQRLSAIFIMTAVLCLFLGAQAFAAEADDSFKAKVGNMTEITDIRYSIQSDKVRIVVDSTKKADYEIRALSQPNRVIIDFNNSWLSPNVAKSQTVSGKIVTQYRVAQFDKNTVRLVIETDVKKDEYEIFAIKPVDSTAHRVVMDFGKKKGKVGIDFSGKPKTTNTTSSTAKSKSSSTSSTTNSTKSSGTVVTNTTPNEVVDTSKNKTTITKKKSTRVPNLTGGIKGKVICLDPGHGGQDSGALGSADKNEEDITLNISLQLRTMLEAQGAKVLMTRTTDTEVSAKKALASDVEELQARCDVANNNGADIFVSIHMDSFVNDTVGGTTGYYYTGGSDASKRLAKLVHEGIVKELKTTDRGTKECNFYVVKHTDMPATLVEVAFISNSDEHKLLTSSSGIQKAAKGILQGLQKFFA